jgi:cell division protein ZapA
MAEVTLTIGDRRHTVSCRDGEETRLRRVGEMLDARWPQALRAAGGAPGERAMLFVALMLADDLLDAASQGGDGHGQPRLERLADALEALANSLEDDLENA